MLEIASYPGSLSPPPREPGYEAMLETDSTSYLYVSQEVKMRADLQHRVTLAKIKNRFFRNLDDFCHG